MTAVGIGWPDLLLQTRRSTTARQVSSCSLGVARLGRSRHALGPVADQLLLQSGRTL
jgi:hypothetical protein